MNNLNLIVKGNKIKITPSIRSYAQQKARRLYRYDGSILNISIELGLEHNNMNWKLFAVRGIVKVNGKTLVATERSANAYAAIDRMTRKLDRKLRHRSRKKRFNRAHLRPIELSAKLPKVPYHEAMPV